MPTEVFVHLRAGFFSGCQQLKDFLLHRVSGFVAENIQRRFLRKLPKCQSRVQVGLLYLPLSIQQRVNEGQPQGLGLGAVDDASGKAAVLL